MPGFRGDDAIFQALVEELEPGNVTQPEAPFDPRYNALLQYMREMGKLDPGIVRDPDVVNPNTRRFVPGYDDFAVPNLDEGTAADYLEQKERSRGAMEHDFNRQYNPEDFIRSSLGQQYRDYPLADRFGQWPEDERQEGIRRLLEEFQNQNVPPAGFDIVDPLGHRGTRHPSGYYMLKGI
jgi:hypothetical protein